MTIEWFDHAFVAFFVFLYPALSSGGYESFLDRIARLGPKARVRAYLGTLGWLIFTSIGVIALWGFAGRPWEGIAIDLRLDGPNIFAGALTLAVVIMLVRQTVALRTYTEADADLYRQFGPLRPFLPHTPGELRLTWLLSIGAGVGEELLYRGYLIWYFSALTNPVFGVILSSILFGLGHAYQGTAGIIRTGIMGLVLALVVVGTGSLLYAVIVHAVVDITSFTAAYYVLKRMRERQSGPEPRGAIGPWS